MISYKTFTIPVAFHNGIPAVNQKSLKDEYNASTNDMLKVVEEGYEIEDVTSAVLNGVMYVHYVLSKGGKK